MTAPPPLARITDRLAARTRRAQMLLGLAATAVLAFLVYLIAPSSAEPESAPVMLASSPPPRPAPLPPPPPVPAPAPSSSVSGLVLRGVLGGGPGGGAAIIGFSDGGQRVVRVGREFLPGVTLKAVAIGHVLLATGAGDMRLAFNKPATAEAPKAASPTRTPVDERRQRETLEFRAGLEPLKENGRITGFAVRPGARLPLLEQAGLRPGDVIVAVNGQAMMSEEKVLELSEEIATSYTAEFDYLRGGKRMKGQMEINKR